MTPRTSKNRRPRLVRVRFKLRTFLIAQSLFCLWLGFHVYHCNRQRNAVDEIRQFGGWVRYSFQFKDGTYDPNGESWVPAVVRRYLGDDFFHPVVEVNLVYSDDSGIRFDNSNFKEAPLECLTDLPKLTGLYLCNTQPSDANLEHVSRLKRLERFFAWDAKNLTDAGVAHLRLLDNLKYVHISDSQITDKSLEIFAELPELEGLSLQFNRFTDAGVARLKKLRRLESLWVCGKRDRPNDITDASLEFLFELPDFSSLGVQRTHVTPVFSNRLTERFPNCRVAQ